MAEQLTNLIQIQIGVDNQKQEPIYSLFEVEIFTKIQEVCVEMLQSVGHFGKLIYNGLPISCDDTFLSKQIKMNDKFVLVP